MLEDDIRENEKMSLKLFTLILTLSAISKVHAFAPVDQQYSHFKNDEIFPWLSNCPSQILSWKPIAPSALTTTMKRDQYRPAQGSMWMNSSPGLVMDPASVPKS